MSLLLVAVLSVVNTPFRIQTVMASPSVVDPNYILEVFATGLDGPFGMAFDQEGNLYVANEGAGDGGTRVSRITPSGEVSKYAEGFVGPSGLAFDNKGNLWVSDDRGCVWKITPGGGIVLGVDFEFANPNAIGFDPGWNLFVADHAGYIYKISGEGIATVFAGPFEGPQAIAFDKSGNLFTSDAGGTIYKIDSQGTVSVFSAGILRGSNGGLTLDDEGNLYACEAGGNSMNVYVFTPEGVGRAFVSGFEPANLNRPRGLVFDREGRLYIAEYGTGIIWRVVPLPVVDFDHNPERPAFNEQITFNASRCYSHGNITVYKWDFGDGGTVEVDVPVIIHVYAREGRYNVTLAVADNYGLWNVKSSQIPITYPTDLNRDCTINILDISIVAMAFGTEEGDPNYNPIADLDSNEEINIVDVSIVALDHGKTV